ncbi:MAG: efflux RND transporter periplasmic adaptor subunit, partial [Candidatus Eisenbacteria bacterium]|nr:efflux RND transporter periplasmic adaptor subunit [Candidatus Latescibacterota bacterium]MBD3301534.1 efflux RND transporter periplasmic adaptor subunit [Candidatus Eisenbacteria bacterium]
MSRWSKRLLVLAAVLVVIVALRLTVFRPSPIPVTVHRVAKGRVEDTVVNSRAGTVESRQRSRMSPGISGLVVEIPVEKGQAVREGDVLLRIDDTEHEAQVNLAARSVDAAEAAAERACLSADQAARELRRAESLAAKNLLSAQGLEEAQTAASTANAECAAARERAKEAAAALASANAILEKTVMVAPFDGVVLDVTTEVGEWISPSPPGVMIPAVIDVIAPDSLYVSAPIDEADVAEVRVGQPCRITLDPFRDRAFDGTVTYVASSVRTEREDSRTLRVEAEFLEDELPTNLLPGLSADLEIILEARDDVLR